MIDSSSARTSPLHRMAVHLLALSSLLGTLQLVPVTAQADTPAVPTPTCNGIQIVSGMNADTIQGLVDANPVGTQFCFSKGTYYLNHYIKLKDSDQFICTDRRQCILDGCTVPMNTCPLDSRSRGALTADYGTLNLLIQGFVVQNFKMVDGLFPIGALKVRAGGTIKDNETRFNDVGIEVDAGNTIYGNYIHDNRIYGLNGGPGDNIFMMFNELSGNNTSHQDPNNDAGGSKIVGTSDTTSHNIQWLNTYVHDNYGQGIWSDGNVMNAVYDGNRIESNAGAGIFHEISWAADIRNNTFNNNDWLERGIDNQSCWNGAQISLNNSQNVTIHDNTIQAVGTNGICMANSTRNETRGFPQALANVSVYNNVIKVRKISYTGFIGDSVPKKVTFTGNTYYVDDLTAAYWEDMSPMTFKQWQAAGFDVTGQLFSW